jgi:hypothetical protein
MSTVHVPAPSLARLRARYAAFQETAQTIVEALGYAEVQGVNLNLDQGVLEIPDGGPLDPGPLVETPNGVTVSTHGG